MSIKRERLMNTDFTAIETGEQITPTHPGIILKEEFLIQSGISAHALSVALRVPATRINDIVRARRSISPDTALRLARYFGTSAEFWTNLQSSYDLRVTEALEGKQIMKEVVPLSGSSHHAHP